MGDFVPGSCAPPASNIPIFPRPPTQITPPCTPFSPTSLARSCVAFLHAASSIAVLPGAGISAESGIPTFRGPGGLWRHKRPETLATPEAFERNPKLVWDWYNWRRGIISQAQPNAGHVALAEIERRASRFTLITQNVDGLHDRAGSRNI